MIENREIEKEKVVNKSKAVLVFQIITAVLYAVLAVLLISSFFESVVFVDKNEPYVGVGIALYLVIFVIMFCGIGAIITSLVSFVGLIISLNKKKKGFLVSKGKIAYFIVFIILPILTVLAIALLTKIVV